MDTPFFMSVKRFIPDGTTYNRLLQKGKRKLKVMDQKRHASPEDSQITGRIKEAGELLGIGGSDAGAICGRNPYASLMSVYYDKTREDTADCDNESMRQGRDLEAYVAQRFKEATGKKVRRSNIMYQSEEYPFMLANVDRLVVGELAGLECKTASAYSADKWKDDNIPVHYQIQCHHYMAVTEAKAWYLASSF